MGIDIVKAETCKAPLAIAFEYVDDYRNVPQWLFGIHEFTPVGPRDRGLDAVFDVSVHLGVHVKTRIKVTDYVEQRVIEFDSIKGFKVRSRWTFEAVDENTTMVTAEVTFNLPFGPAGKAMGKVMEPMVTKAVQHSSHELVRRVEALVP